MAHLPLLHVLPPFMRACSSLSTAVQRRSLSALARRRRSSSLARSTASLDLGDPSSVCDAPVLVVGGGFTGLGAAATLIEAGVSVLLTEQGRGVGGRVTTRHVRGSELTFDHGAQYFAPQPGSRFHELLLELERAGSVARWAGGRLGRLSANSESGQLVQNSFTPWEDNEKTAFVGLPTMSAVGRALLSRSSSLPGAGRLTVAAGTRCAPGLLRRLPDGFWQASTHPKAEPTSLRTSTHRAVLACGSASSTFNVVSPVAPALAEPASRVRSSPCWALMAAFSSPLFPETRPWDGALVEGSADVAWLAANSSKPQRPGAPVETWVMHSTPGFDTATAIPAAGGGGGDAAADAMLAALLRFAGRQDSPPAVLYSEAFRWNAAFPKDVAAKPCFVDTALGLGLCGDWCVGPRVGDAWESGRAAALALLEAEAAGELSLGR